MWNHLWIYNTMLLSNCLLNLDLIYEKSPSNIHEPSKTNMLTPQNVMSQMLPQCTLLYPVFSLLVSYTHFPKDFRTMTSPSTLFYGLRKCHLSQSSLAIYGSFSEISFNSSSNFLFKPNNTILSDKVRSGRTILSLFFSFFFNWKVIHQMGFEHMTSSSTHTCERKCHLRQSSLAPYPAKMLKDQIDLID